MYSSYRISRGHAHLGRHADAPYIIWLLSSSRHIIHAGQHSSSSSSIASAEASGAVAAEPRARGNRKEEEKKLQQETRTLRASEPSCIPNIVENRLQDAAAGFSLTSRGNCISDAQRIRARVYLNIHATGAQVLCPQDPARRAGRCAFIVFAPWDYTRSGSTTYTRVGGFPWLTRSRMMEELRRVDFTSDVLLHIMLYTAGDEVVVYAL